MHSFARVAFPSFAALVGLTVAPTQAAIIGIDDFSGDETVLTFDDSFSSTAAFSIGGVTFNTLSDSSFSTWDALGPYFDNIPGSSQGNGVVVDGTTQTFQILWSEPVLRVGLLLSTDIVNTWTVSAYDAKGVLIEIADFVNPAGGDAVFAGFESSTPIISLIVDDPDGDRFASAFDDLRFESVPEPTTLMLIGTGLGLITSRRALRPSA